MNQLLNWILCLVIVAAECQQVAGQGCSQKSVGKFMDNHLSSNCKSGLTNLQYPMLKTDDNFVPFYSSSDLDTVCQQNCGGKYSSWLVDSCDDRHTARMVEAMCVFTHETAQVGPRCRYSFPDAVYDLKGYFMNVLTCGLGGSPGSCPAKCRESMNTLIDLLGCCYQSMYNNTEFIQYLENTGKINSTMAESLHFLNRVLEWEDCAISIPPMCEMITFDSPSSAPNNSCFMISSIVFFTLISLVLQH